MSSTKLAILGGTPAVPAGPPLGVPAYDEAAQAAILDVANGPVSDSGGPHASANRRLEEVTRDFTRARYAVSLPNATTAVRMALQALGIGPGAEVITSALDWKSTAATAAALGATVRFADIDPATLHMDPGEAKKLITPNTSAIFISHVHGTVADMAPWLALTNKYGLWPIEDAAQALGAMWRGLMAGTIGCFGCFSFNWKKLMRTGDGTVLITGWWELFQALISAANFGHEPSRAPGDGETASHYSLYLGGNERLNPLAAAAAAAVFDQIPGLLRTANRTAEILTSRIGQIPGLSVPQIPEGSTSTYHLLRVIIDPEEFGWTGSPTELRDRFRTAVEAEGTLGVGYWRDRPLSDERAFRLDPPAFRTVHSYNGRVRPVDPESMPVTRRVLNNSVVFGRTPHAFQDLTEATAHHYADAIEKVATNMREVMSWSDFTPLKLHPPVPEE